MWIRSQNKLVLSEVKRIVVLSPNYFRKKFEIVNYIASRPVGESDVCEDYDTLGDYETKERVLEILDLIQHHITTLEHNKMLINEPQEQYNYENYVFEMPKE